MEKEYKTSQEFLLAIMKEKGISIESELDEELLIDLKKEDSIELDKEILIDLRKEDNNEVKEAFEKIMDIVNKVENFKIESEFPATEPIIKLLKHLASQEFTVKGTDLKDNILQYYIHNEVDGTKTAFVKFSEYLNDN